MIKKIIAGTLIVVVLGTTSAMAYTNPIDITRTPSLSTETATKVEVEKKEIEVISPKITLTDEVLPTKNLLISVKVLTESSVFLSVYKVLEENEEVILGPEEIKTGENFNTYNTEIKDIMPGNYKMEFIKEGQQTPFEVVNFKLLKQGIEEVPDLTVKKFMDLLLGQ